MREEAMYMQTLLAFSRSPNSESTGEIDERPLRVTVDHAQAIRDTP